MLRISVAIATYNRAHLIGETLGYVLGQSHPIERIVVVNDGSSDETEATIARLAIPNVELMTIANVGPGAALKAAIDACDSEWIAMCDDDDRWHPDHLARHAALVERYPDTDFAFANFASFGEGAIPGFEEFDAIPAQWWDGLPACDADDFQYIGRDAFARLLVYNPVFPTSVLMRRALYERCGGIDPKFSRLGCWDAHLTWRAALHGTLACDRRVTVETRKHRGNFSRKRSVVNAERAAMLEAAWRDGWIPREYGPDIERALVATRLRASEWAWHEHDYRQLRTQLAAVPRAKIPAPMQLRRWLAHLPSPALDLLRKRPAEQRPTC